ERQVGERRCPALRPVQEWRKRKGDDQLRVDDGLQEPPAVRERSHDEEPGRGDPRPTRLRLDNDRNQPGAHLRRDGGAACPSAALLLPFRLTKHPLTRVAQLTLANTLDLLGRLFEEDENLTISQGSEITDASAERPGSTRRRTPTAPRCTCRPRH